MIRYRPFRNSDPPALAEIWRSQPPLHRLAQPMTAALWEEYVLSKTYFDPAGLIVAVDGPRPIGFVHAGFGPTELGDRLDPSHGVICRLFVMPHDDSAIIRSELLSAGEHYLAQRGAHDVVIGNIDPLGPFYLGLYGSSRLPGVLKSDAAQLGFFTAAGYEPAGERVVLQRSLSGYRPPIDRDQVKHRKVHDVIAHVDPLAQTWWEACATSHLERTYYELIPKVGRPVIATAMTAHLQPLSMAWGVHAAGFEDVAALSEAWQNGTAMFLLAETMKALQCQGVTVIEAVLDDPDSPLGRVLTTLGFKEVDRGAMLSKRFGEPGA